MEKLIVQGGKKLNGHVTLQGAKNVALKIFVASLLTDDPVIIHNVPRIRDVFIMLEVLDHLGVESTLSDHSVRLQLKHFHQTAVPLEVGIRLRTSSLVLGPLLARFGTVVVPNPGGCRLGARPIDRHIQALESMGAHVYYDSQDGYFHGKAHGLHGATITFEKNTHTGTEAVILAAVLAKGKTVIKNAAQEVEIDDLISCLNSMGGNVKRTKANEIVIQGVSDLHGTEFTIISDRNEEVTFAVAAALTGGSITVTNSERKHLASFLKPFRDSGCIAEELSDFSTTYRSNGTLRPTHITTSPHPGFMTDWQAPWAVLMTKAQGISTIHETVFESRFSYVDELKKMGAHIDFFDPEVSDPAKEYNFNWEDRIEGTYQAIKIKGQTKLHNAVCQINDIRAGATVLLAALSARGKSILYQAETVDRGYESIEEKLRTLGANIVRIKEDIV